MRAQSTFSTNTLWQHKKRTRAHRYRDSGVVICINISVRATNCENIYNNKEKLLVAIKTAFVERKRERVREHKKWAKMYFAVINLVDSLFGSRHQKKWDERRNSVKMWIRSGRAHKIETMTTITTTTTARKNQSRCEQNRKNWEKKATEKNNLFTVNKIQITWNVRFFAIIRSMSVTFFLFSVF